MDYTNIINDIPNEKIIQLIKGNQLDWFIFTSIENQKKLNTFTRSQLIEADFEKGLSDYSCLLETSLNFPQNSEIYIIANKYFQDNLFVCAKSSSFLIKKFLKEHTTKKNELLDSIAYFDEVTISLLFGEKAENIAYLINSNKICIRSLSEHIDKFSVAEVNTFIDYKNYSHFYKINCLLTLFPINKTFPMDVAEHMVKVVRNSFLKLPLQNQANGKLFVFATNHIIYGDNWTVSDYPDPQNIPISKLDDQILNYIEIDHDGLMVAKAFVDYKPEYVLHKNIQKFINNPEYAYHFGAYKDLFNEEQKSFSGIYTVDNVPLDVEIRLMYQDEDVLIELIKKTKNNYQMLGALHCLLKRNIKINDCFDDTTRTKIIKALDILLTVGLDNGVRYFNNETILKVVELVMDISVDFKLLRLLEKTCENKKDFDDLLMRKLTKLEKIEYLES